MDKYIYPVTLSKDTNGTILVDFPDFPEAHTFGENKEEAMARAVDALATVLDAYISDRRDIPTPSLSEGPVVILPALTTAKVALYELMRGDRVGKAELARRLNWHLPQVDRLLDVHHSSQLDQLEQAFNVLGQRLIVYVTDAKKMSQPREGKRLDKGARKASKTRHARSTNMAASRRVGR